VLPGGAAAQPKEIDMNKSLRNTMIGLSLATLCGLSFAASQPAGAAPSSSPEASATNVATPTTKAAKKVVKRHKRAHHAKHAAKKHAA
jgi:hypothetical protein